MVGFAQGVVGLYFTRHLQILQANVSGYYKQCDHVCHNECRDTQAHTSVEGMAYYNYMQEHMLYLLSTRFQWVDIVKGNTSKET